ncbi:MAG: hypothetical protein NVS2B14_15840 [Chamaesiphon sp.]
MFRQVLSNLSSSELDYKQLTLYLDRHIHLDEDVHSPMGKQMLKNLNGEDEQKWRESTIAAQIALLARILLWDGVVEQIRKSRQLLVA